ncbi:ribbon-helix-helix protein, CopG family [Puerhibacterium sp. TATVAM-FAB25]|uniref:ribbon-helix-helix protein, CopG family n=1 Tax=Puerhibacterium sp. TATVAM-FAB25 TaxID=3093699 RepID=UPI00397E5A5E
MAPVLPARQTSVRVPREAIDALDRAAAEAEKSRDATMRDLLANYIRVQSARAPDERLTHLTTVLRLPRVRPGRNREDPRRHLRLRVADTLKIAALEHAFLLPGQSPRHGHHDYAGRPLTDIVMTAIELAEPIRLPGLDGLPRMLPQRTALGLWRLTVAATLTPAERRAIWGSEVADLVSILTEEDVAWHHPWRFEVAEHLLRRIYDQPRTDVVENVDMLYDQTEAFVDLLAAVRRADFSTAWLTDGLPHRQSNVDGRGGAAVWRAKRNVSLEALGGWATTPKASGEVNIVPPGWNLKLPLDWRIHAFGHLEPVPAPLLAHAAGGRVATLAWRSRTAYWPLDVHGDPIPGFAAVVQGGERLTPERLLETVLHQLDYPHVGVPAPVAHALGFITEQERDNLMAMANKLNEERVASTLKWAERRLENDEYVEMLAAASDLKRFERLARRHHLRFVARRAQWIWEMGSVPQALEEGHSADRVAFLTEAMSRITTRILEADMEFASKKAFFLGATTPTDSDL